MQGRTDGEAAADTGAGVGPIEEPTRGGESGFMEDPTLESAPDPDEREAKRRRRDEEVSLMREMIEGAGRVMKMTDGRKYDIDDKGSRARIIQELKRERPRLLVGSPLSAWFSTPRRKHRERLGEAAFQRELERAIRQVDFMCCLYRIQLHQGGYIRAV